MDEEFLRCADVVAGLEQMGGERSLGRIFDRQVFNERGA